MYNIKDIDLPSLQSIELGAYTFSMAKVSVIESNL